MSEHLMNTYARQAVTFVKGEGVWLWDDKGERYLDALSGVAVNGLGHSHPKFVAALTAQASRLIHVSNNYQIAEQVQLADKLCEITGMDRVFFWIRPFMAARWRRYLLLVTERRKLVLSLW